MGTFSIQIKTSTDMSLWYAQRERMKDFSVPFDSIIEKWTESNERKFNAGQGAEYTGASTKDLDPNAWEPLQSLTYARQKRSQGFSDWLMVRTGELMTALTTRGGFAEYFDEHRAIFGTPLDSSDADKALYNSQMRPTVFLSEPDRLMIKAEMQNYITFGGDYTALLRARAGSLAAIKKQIARMDVEFASIANG